MEKAEKKTLKEKLIVAVNNVLKKSQPDISSKMEKIVKKSIRRIVKKADKEMEQVSE